MNLHIHNTYDPVTQVITTAGVAPYIWDDSNSHANYSKPTDFATVDLMIETAPDYKCGRDYLKSVFLTKGTDEECSFDNCTNEEKTIACKHELGLESQRISHVGQKKNVSDMVIYDDNAVASRVARGKLVLSMVRNEFPTNKTAILGVAQTAFELYMKYGIEGIDRGDLLSGVDDYINSKNDYAQSGLSQSGFTPLTMSLSDFCSKSTNLLLEGNYNIYE